MRETVERTRRSRRNSADIGALPDRPDEQEFYWFFRAEYPPVASTVYLILRDRGAAEEIAQEAFVSAFTHWHRISRYDRPELWVRRVAIRMAMRAAQRERVRRVL
jgi:RNA polymerase sigma-70 factor (ECF subfamily)